MQIVIAIVANRLCDAADRHGDGHWTWRRSGRAGCLPSGAQGRFSAHDPDRLRRPVCADVGVVAAAVVGGGERRRLQIVNVMVADRLCLRALLEVIVRVMIGFFVIVRVMVLFIIEMEAMVAQ